MKNISERALWAILKATAITLAIFYIFILILSFPQNHPDATLSIGDRLQGFLNEITLRIKLTRLSWQGPDKEILMPVYGVRVREVQDSWQAPRPDGRFHEGQDIFANKGTPVFSATKGFVVRLGIGDIGGNYVYIAGAGGRRYYYAHFEKIAEGLKRGQEVTTDTVLGFVGNSGNAENTPPHLHFGVYAFRIPINPLTLLISRN